MPLQFGLFCAHFSRSSYSCAFFTGVARADNSSARRKTAKNQFERAEKEYQALEARPEKDRSLKDYTSVLNAYRRVYLITPRAAEVPAALNQVAGFIASWAISLMKNITSWL